MLDIGKIQERAQEYHKRFVALIDDILTTDKDKEGIGPSVLTAVLSTAARFAGQMGVERSQFRIMASEAYNSSNGLDDTDDAKDLQGDELYTYYGERIQAAIHDIMGPRQDTGAMSAIATVLLTITARFHAFAPRMTPDVFGKMCRALMEKLYQEPDIKAIRDQITPRIIT